MRNDDLTDLPDWDDEKFSRYDEEGEEWKPRPTREACKALYLKWREIITMLNGALGNDFHSDDAHLKSYTDDFKQMVLGDAYEVGAKIRSSEVGGMYVLRMENAAIIRKNAQSVASSLLSLGAEGAVEEKYVELIRTEIDVFKELFKVWVGTFEKDEFTDDWGLFV
ncbi:hypothetical protein A8C56_14210 [Niabella ginsenosidivorans]|uniref:Uncharacterized protein n=1 Tax=Niabella ginsenosidivorans TaxID=1176587 RepID=A0A1A9I4J5_9BACT|nr:hypothetical protein [Niabella ginsenosidivorans]ANH81969.1 hypothetical protein A8C56_14210 [Niabella ginsenosidivorans]